MEVRSNVDIEFSRSAADVGFGLLAAHWHDTEMGGVAAVGSVAQAAARSGDFSYDGIALHPMEVRKSTPALQCCCCDCGVDNGIRSGVHIHMALRCGEMGGLQLWGCWRWDPAGPGGFSYYGIALDPMEAREENACTSVLLLGFWCGK
jgi:hypothetical protein